MLLFFAVLSHVQLLDQVVLPQKLVCSSLRVYLHRCRCDSTAGNMLEQKIGQLGLLPISYASELCILAVQS